MSGATIYAYVGGNPLGAVDPYGLFESSPWLRSLVPGQVAFDHGMTAIENGNYGAAAVGFGAMLGEMVMTATTFGTSRAAGMAAQQCEVRIASKSRVFTSEDPLVGNLATKIEAAYPGHVVGVNVPVRDAAGRLVTDADILLKNGIVQVKSGGGKGMTSQLQRTERATGIPTIGYGPDLKPSILRSCAATNCERTLIEVIKP